MRQQYGRRSQVLSAALAFFAFAIVFQMTRIQNSPEADTFRQLSKDYSYEWRTFYPNRGEIYDRNGRLLAGEKIVYEIGVDLNIMTDAHAIAFAVADALGMDYDNLMSVIQNPPDGLSYIVLADYVESAQANYLQDLKKALNEQAPDGSVGGLTGLQFKSHPQRSYPENSLASNILGFVNREGKGYFGVEEKYDSLLAGNPVTVLVPTDPNKAFEIPNAPDGTTMVLTINRDLQATAEEILDTALGTYGAQDGIIAVMDPQSGEMLAVATSRRMDLNEFWNYPDRLASARRSRQRRHGSAARAPCALAPRVALGRGDRGCVRGALPAPRRARARAPRGARAHVLPEAERAPRPADLERAPSRGPRDRRPRRAPRARGPERRSTPGRDRRDRVRPPLARAPRASRSTRRRDRGAGRAHQGIGR